ncbi:MAG: phage holin family protein [Deltaproteobacteria bacterium]|nr:phage holin family protein [Deltaproteobacteria bacterium]
MLEEAGRDIRGAIAPHIVGIVEDAQQLMRQEIALARTEMRHEVMKAKRSAIALSVGAAFALATALLVSWTMVYALGALFPELPLWACFGVIALIYAAAAAMFIAIGKSSAQEVHVVPTQTVESIKENLKWVKQRV